MGMQFKLGNSESDRSASLEKYINLVNDCRNRGYNPGTLQLELLMALMENELLRSGTCGLLNYCVSSWKNHCQERGFWLEMEAPGAFSIQPSAEIRRMGSFDTMVIPFLLGTYLNDPKRYFIEARRHLGEMFRQRLVQNFHPEAMAEYVGWIDKGMSARCVRSQPQTEAAAPGFCHEGEALLAQARKDAQTLREEGARERDSIVAAARQEAQQILEDARANANGLSQRILDQAAEDAKRKTAEIVAAAEVEQREQKRQERYEDFSEEHRALTDGLDGLRRGIVELNNQMRTMETNLTSANTRKAFTQLSELYELMADVRDTIGRKKEHNPELEDMYFNLESFLQLITEYMADYGIHTIETAPGAPFSGKYHHVRSGMGFDPTQTKIRESLRCGFRWGDTVLKKENVVIYGEDE